MYKSKKHYKHDWLKKLIREGHSLVKLRVFTFPNYKIYTLSKKIGVNMNYLKSLVFALMLVLASTPAFSTVLEIKTKFSSGKTTVFSMSQPTFVSKNFDPSDILNS